MKKFKHLFIIGNGFDLHHGIKSSYYDFCNWLTRDGFSSPNDTQLYNILTRVYHPKNKSLWSDLEFTLPLVGAFALNNNLNYSPLLLNINLEQSNQTTEMAIKTIMIDDGFHNNLGQSESMVLENVMDEIGLAWDNLYARLYDSFYSWVLELNETPVNKDLSFPIENSHFINFNYTNTLERVYSIPHDQITYIHGCAHLQEELIFGYNKSELAIRNSFKDVSNWNERKNFISSLLMLRKPISKIIKKYRKLWSLIRFADDVHIWGHGLGSVDLPYLCKIAGNMNNDAISEINWFIKEEGKSEDQLIYEALHEITKITAHLKFIGFSNLRVKHLNSYKIQNDSLYSSAYTKLY